MTTTVAEKVQRLERKLADAAGGGDTMTETVDRFEVAHPARQRLPRAVQRLLDGLTTGNWDAMEEHFTPDAVHDGSMPGWRLQYQGPARIVQELRESWTPHGRTWDITEQHVTQAGDTVTVELECHLASSDEPLMCRMANVIQLRGGRIAEHRYYCCGEWDETTVRQIAAEAPKVARPGAQS